MSCEISQFLLCHRVNEAEETVAVVYIITSSLVYINGIQLAKFGLLLDRTSSI